MAHYAFLDENNIVTEVIVGKDEGTDGINWEEWYGNFKNQTCKRTSYNTYKNTHVNGGTPFRGTYAGIGFLYDEENDKFIPPQPYASWTWDDSSYSWQPPIPQPEDEDLVTEWNEESYQNDNNVPKTAGWDIIN